MHFLYRLAFACFLVAIALVTWYATGFPSSIQKLVNPEEFRPDSSSYVDHLNRIGFLSHMSDADSSLYYGMQAKALAERLDYPKGKAEALANIGASLFLNGLYSQALQHFAGAQVIYEQTGDEIGEVNMMTNVAVVYDVIGDSTRALSISSRALAMSPAFEMDSSMSMIYPNYVYLHPHLTRDSAFYFLDKAEKIARKYDDQRSRIMIMQQKAAKFLPDHDADSAFALISESLTIAGSQHFDYHQVVGLQYLADYYIAINRPDSALAAYRKAYDLAVKNKFSTFQMELLRQQKQLLDPLRQPDQLARVEDLLNRVIEKELARSRQFVGDYVAFREQQQALVLTQTEQRASDIQNRILLICLLVVLVIAGYIVYLYRKNLFASNQQLLLNRQIADKNQQLNQEAEAKAAVMHRLELSHQELNRQFQIRTHLMSAISHDIRTPLRYVLIAVQRLHASLQEKGSEEQKDLGSGVIQSTRKILQLLDNMIVYSKNLQRQGPPETGRILLSELVEEKAQLFQGMIQQQGNQLVIDIDPAFAVQSNSHLLSIVIHNLIDNANKFCYEGTILISAHTVQGVPELVVSDSGPGFEAYHAEWLNAPLNREGAVPPTPPGHGLGLLIVREVCGLLGIRVHVANNDGAHVTLRFAG